MGYLSLFYLWRVRSAPNLACDGPALLASARDADVRKTRRQPDCDIHRPGSGGYPAEAKYEFEQTLRYDAASVETRYGLGTVLSALSQNSDALASFDAALRLKPDFGAAHLARAETLYAMGRYEEAARAVDAARANGAQADAGFLSELARKLRR